MINPYEPPRPTDNHQAPLWKRVRRGLARAAAEYRAGLKREGMTGWQHFRAWLTLLALLCFLVTALLLIVYLGFSFGIRRIL